MKEYEFCGLTMFGCNWLIIFARILVLQNQSIICKFEMNALANKAHFMINCVPSDAKVENKICLYGIMLLNIFLWVTVRCIIIFIRKFTIAIYLKKSACPKLLRLS